MSRQDLTDAMFNMRAPFYDKTRKPKKKVKPGKAGAEPARVRELRRNVRLHQKPTRTSSE